MKNLTALQTKLLGWYHHSHRDLPWRRTKDPYKIWVSEVMLQQTQVATVIPYYERWIERFPTPQALAQASSEEVLKAWEGLGYYSRVRNLHSACREVVERYEGKVPDSLEEIQSLPGVGRYTAGAILSIAYERPVPVVDGNVQRVLARLFAIWKDPRQYQVLFWKRAEELLSKKVPGTFNQALMELGATICTPTKPACLICPIEKFCEARIRGIQDLLPMKEESKKPIQVRLASALIQKNGQILLCQRPQQSKGHLSGMWELPTIPLNQVTVTEEGCQVRLNEFLRQTMGASVVFERSFDKLATSRTKYRLEFLVFSGYIPTRSGFTPTQSVGVRESRATRGKMGATPIFPLTTHHSPLTTKLGYPSDMARAQWVPIKKLSTLPLPGVFSKFLRSLYKL